MRVIVLLTDAFGGQGGIAKFNRDLLSSICSYPAVEQAVALPRLIPGPVEALPSKLKYIRAAARGKVKFFSTALKSSLLARGPSLIICAHINLLPAAFAMRLFCRAPVVLVIHGIDAWQPSRSRLVNRLVKKIDAFISVSEFTRRRFLEWANLGGTKSFILPNSIDMTLFTPGPKRDDLISRYGLGGRKVIMTLARLSASERYKGIDELMEILPSLAAEIPEITYLICGDGDDRARLEQKAAQLGLRVSEVGNQNSEVRIRPPTSGLRPQASGARVVFAGYIPETEKADHYRLADAFVMAGRGEGFGIVYLEAMACGITVMASKADGSREAVRDGQLGVLVEPGNPEELKVAIAQALSADANASDRKSPVGVDYFSFYNFERRCHQILEQLLPGPVTQTD